MTSIVVAPLDSNNKLLPAARDNFSAVFTAAQTAASLQNGLLHRYDATSASVVQTLPSAPATGFTLGLRRMDAVTANTVTYVAGGSDLLEPSPFTISTGTVGVGRTVWLVYNSGVWTATLGHLTTTGVTTIGDARYPAFTPTALQRFYIVPATGSDTNRGTDPGTAFATLAAAYAAAGSVRARYILWGTASIATADTHGNGFSLDQVGSTLEGLGNQLSTVNITGTATWGVQALAAACKIIDITIIIASTATVTYGCGVSTPTSSGSCEHCTFEQVFVTSAANITAAFAVGPDHSGSGSLDIAWTELRHCYYNTTGGAVITHGYLIGNGTTGNILATTAVGCAGGPSTNGVTLAGAGINWVGGGFENTTATDINVTQGNGHDTMLFTGLRSEGGNQVVNAGYVGVVGGLTLIDYVAGAYTPTGGSNIVTWNAGGPLTLQGGSYSTTGGTTAFAVNTSHGSPVIAFTARDVVADSAIPYPAAAASIQRNISNAQTTAGGTTHATPLSAYVQVVDNAPASSPPAVTFAGPFTPTGTVSTSAVMGGLAVAFTPASTGKVLCRINGGYGTETGVAIVSLGGRYGTGTAPANGVAVSAGTSFSQGTLTLNPSTFSAASRGYFELTGIITGLTASTVYWFDLYFSTNNASDEAILSGLIVTVEECT